MGISVTGGKRVALVTGASGGLGSAVTPMFRDAGYAVETASLDKPMRADLSVRRNAERVVKAVLKKHGRIDAVAHLVGSFEGGQTVDATDDAVWDRMLAVNLRAALNVMRCVIPVMERQKHGRIAVIASTSATHPVVTWSAFSASVAALCSLVQTSAAELRETGVTVNALLPTTIDTPIVRKFCGEADAPKWVDARAIGELLLWLCSERGGDVNGALLPMVGRQPHPCHHWHGETDT